MKYIPISKSVNQIILDKLLTAASTELFLLKKNSFFFFYPQVLLKTDKIYFS